MAAHRGSRTVTFAMTKAYATSVRTTIALERR
jgi:hypothetical protein